MHLPTHKIAFEIDDNTLHLAYALIQQDNLAVGTRRQQLRNWGGATELAN